MGVLVKHAGRASAAALTLLLLAAVARYWHPQYGFTPLIVLNAGSHETELPRLRAIPHFEYAGDVAYDGAYYAQLALDPLLQDPAIDRALDSPAYRARRILFSWTAYVLGLGRPAWIIQAYALQNVLAWIALAWLMTRWLPLTSGRGFAGWVAVMFSHGLLLSIRFAVLDGPSLLLLALAIAAAERERLWRGAAVLALAALGRETNILGAVALPLPAVRRDWARFGVAAVVMVVPMLIWQDYLYSIYRGTMATGVDHITLPFAGYLTKWIVVCKALRDGRIDATHLSAVCILVSLTSQLIFIATHAASRDPWWRLSMAFAVLMMVMNYAVWEGHPGAATRVLLPLTFGFNVVLSRGSHQVWPWYLGGNLHLLPASGVLPFPWLGAPY